MDPDLVQRAVMHLRTLGYRTDDNWIAAELHRQLGGADASSMPGVMLAGFIRSHLR